MIAVMVHSGLRFGVGDVFEGGVQQAEGGVGVE
jgi:hypothetical protein